MAIERYAEQDEAKERRLLSIVLPSVIALVMLALVIAESETHAFELRVTAPASVAPGDPIPVRAELLSEMERPEGPEVVRAAVRARLLDERGREVARERLAPSALAGAEGQLRAPDRAGAMTLVVESGRGLGDMRVERRITIGRPSPLERRARRTVATAPARSPIEAVGAAAPPSHLDLALENGLCVPEVPCRLFVRVGEPAAALHVEPGATVTVARTPAPAERAGLVDAEIVVRGPEPSLTLVATRDGAPVARREIGLPAGRGGVRLAAATRVLAPGARVRVTLTSFDGPRAAAIDVLREGRWVGATSIDTRGAELGADVVLPTTPGRYMLVARGDFVSNDATSNLVVAVGEPVDPLALGEASAAEEARVVVLPPFTSAILQANTGAVQRLTTRRWLAALVIVLCGALASVRVYRRVQASSREARAILEAAGDDAAQSDAHLREDRRTAWIVAALVFTAFAFAAALVLSRSVI